MQIGVMYWNDNSKTSLPEKIQEAVLQYKEKYKFTPDTCAINLNKYEEELNKNKELFVKLDVAVIGMKTILPDHFWIGMKDDKLKIGDNING